MHTPTHKLLNRLYVMQDRALTRVLDLCDDSTTPDDMVAYYYDKLIKIDRMINVIEKELYEKENV